MSLPLSATLLTFSVVTFSVSAASVIPSVRSSFSSVFVSESGDFCSAVVAVVVVWLTGEISVESSRFRLLANATLAATLIIADSCDI